MKIQITILALCVFVASTAYAESSIKLSCGLDQIDDEVVSYISLTEKCPKTPNNLKSLTDFNGGGLFADYEGGGAKGRGAGYRLSREQLNSHRTGKVCYYTGCRKLAVSSHGERPTSEAQRWNACLKFSGGSSVPHPNLNKCPTAIKVGGRYRELIENVSREKQSCCYEVNAPIPP
jgi:hypothetical protein